MLLIDFIKQLTENKDRHITVFLEWFWVSDGIDEEYSFEGSPEEFVEKYTEHYDCIEGFDIYDVFDLEVKNEGWRTSVYINIVRE